MKTEWKEEYLSHTPQEFEKVNADTWIQRKDIKKVDSGYSCMSRFISNDIKAQIDITRDVLSESYDIEGYKIGYEAAAILFGGTMSADPVIRATELRTAIEISAQSLSDEDAVNVPELFPSWEDGHSYQIGDRVSRGDTLYKCIQDHVSQSDWLPENTPSLWNRMDDPEEEWPEWRQPTGAHDAYEKGYKVSHNNKHWISTVDGNVWEPGVYGWDET